MPYVLRQNWLIKTKAVLELAEFIMVHICQSILKGARVFLVFFFFFFSVKDISNYWNSYRMKKFVHAVLK